MGCCAQNFVTVQVKGNQKSPAVEADKVYLSACSVVQREFGGNRVPRPQVTLILGAEVNRADRDHREIKLIKWDPYLFAQGVVVFAFEDLLPTEVRLTAAKRAIALVNSTVGVNSFAK